MVASRDVPAPSPDVLDDEERMPYSQGYTRYVMVLLMIMLIVNFLDRQIINILAEPIKVDLGLADWQLGVMTGFAFAIFYTVLGVPIAGLADRTNRTKIIGIAIMAWSVFTALCATAQNFVQLVVYRIGVGVGEAGGTPPAHSLIVDYVPKSRRAFWLAFYSIGNPIGALLGMVFGGLVAGLYGWRVAFLIAGLPGLLLGLLVLFTMREPRALLARYKSQSAQAASSIRETLAYLATKKTFWLIAFSASIKAFIGYGHAPFTASFFLRSHTVEIGALTDILGGILNMDLAPIAFLGIALGFGMGFGGVAGTLLGGYIADRLAARDISGYMLSPALSVLAAIPVYITALLVDSALLAIALLCLNSFLTAFWYGPVFSTTQTIARPNMRATAAALLLLIINLIGLGFGPLAAGLLSDVLNEAGLGVAEGLRYALITTACLGIIPFFGFLWARKTIRADVSD